MAISEAQNDQSSLLLFHKIHCGAVSIEKGKYMTPAHSLKTTRPSHSRNTADTRHTVDCGALKNPPPPRTIPNWNSLSPSVANIQSTEVFMALLIKTKIQPKVFLCFFLLLWFLLLFFVVFIFYFIKVSELALPGVMLKYERASNDRKKYWRQAKAIS